MKNLEKKTKAIVVTARFRGPGPCYGLPPTVGYKNHDITKEKRPAYSMRPMTLLHDHWRSPGPVHMIPPRVTRTGVEGSPKYTNRMRCGDGEYFISPAPNTYYNENYLPPQGEKQAPFYSMRERTRYLKSDPNPAPNRYTLPKVIGYPQPDKKCAPVSSLHRTLIAGAYNEDLAKGPGPKYPRVSSNVNLQKAPVFSMRGMIKMPSDRVTKPGPASHRRENVVVNMPHAPEYSMRVRHSEYGTIMLTEDEG